MLNSLNLLTEHSEPVVDGDHDNLTKTRQYAAVKTVSGTELVAFTVNEDHHGKFVVWVSISWRGKEKTR